MGFINIWDSTIGIRRKTFFIRAKYVRGREKGRSCDRHESPFDIHIGRAQYRFLDAPVLSQDATLSTVDC